MVRGGILCCRDGDHSIRNCYNIQLQGLQKKKMKKWKKMEKGLMNIRVTTQ